MPNVDSSFTHTRNLPRQQTLSLQHGTPCSIPESQGFEFSMQCPFAVLQKLLSEIRLTKKMLNGVGTVKVIFIIIKAN